MNLFSDHSCTRAGLADVLRAELDGKEVELCPHCQADELAEREASRDPAGDGFRVPGELPASGPPLGSDALTRTLAAKVGATIHDPANDH